MGDIRLTVVLVAFFAFSFHMDRTNGLIFHTSRSFPPGASSGQENTNEEFRMPPFLPFFSFFRHRNPFIHVPLEGKNDGLPSGKDEESKINNTLSNKTKVAARTVEKDVDPLKNKTSNSTDQSVSKSINPLGESPKKSILEAFPMYHFRRWRFEAPALEKTDVKSNAATTVNNTTEDVNNNFEGQKHHVSKKLIILREEYDNSRVGKYPLGMALNNSLMADAENCTRRQFFTRYFFIWTINWASLITHLTVILLITALVTCALILCRPYCENGEQNTKLLKIKPLLV